MNDDKPTTYYLYVTPWVAFGYSQRPCWILRAIQRALLGWRWYANENATLYSLSVGDPVIVEPYHAHELPGPLDQQIELLGTVDDKIPIYSTDLTWPREPSHPFDE